MESELRDKFEHWLRTETTSLNHRRTSDGGYEKYEIDLAWRAWQKASELDWSKAKPI